MMSTSTHAPRRANVNIDAIVRALDVILQPGQVTELRILDATTASDRWPHIESGYFDDHRKLAEAAATITSAKGIYFTPNPVNPSLLARASNRSRAAGKNPTTSDTDIVRRNWLLIDLDATRPAGISASDAEHHAAIELAFRIRAELSSAGWPEALVADSGNGAHLMYRIDMPADDGKLVECCLKALAERYSTEQVEIDTTVHNPARIWKLYGTLASKGDDTPDRPHRMAAILESPEVLEVVPEESLTAMAATITTSTTTTSKTTTSNGSTFDLPRWIADHRLDIRGPENWKGGTKYIFKTCPWNDAHTNSSAFIIQHASGAIAAGCHHNGCADKGWHDLRDVVEPGWRERKAQALPLKASADVPIMVKDTWPDALDVAAFHGLVGEIVSEIEPHSEADPAALLVQTLVAVGNIIGRTAYFRAEADRHFGNLFATLVGRTSKGRKGTSWGQIGRLTESIDRDWHDTRVLSGLSSGEGLIWAVRDPIFKSEPIRKGGGKGKSKGTITGYQDVEVDAGVVDKRLLVLESELGGVLRVIAREKNTLSAIMRQAWDSGNLRTLTKNSPAVATGAHISIIGHVTRDELRRLITDTDMANGLANRVLWVCVRRSKNLPEGGGEPALGPLVDRLRDVVTFAKTAGEIKRDDHARRIWHEVYPSLSDGKPGLLGAATSRAEAQTMRLAMLYAVLDESHVIRAEHLMAALALWGYCEASAKYIFGSALGDPTADEIVRALREARTSGLTRNAIREHFGRHKAADEINRALTVLLEQGQARFETATDTGGRPAERWFGCA